MFAVTHQYGTKNAKSAHDKAFFTAKEIKQKFEAELGAKPEMNQTSNSVFATSSNIAHLKALNNGYYEICSHPSSANCIAEYNTKSGWLELTVYR